jgi:hypothetical protein
VEPTTYLHSRLLEAAYLQNLEVGGGGGEGRDMEQKDTEEVCSAVYRMMECWLKGGKMGRWEDVIQ